MPVPATSAYSSRLGAGELTNDRLARIVDLWHREPEIQVSLQVCDGICQVCANMT